MGIPAGSRVLLTLPAQTGADPKTKESVAVVIDVLGLHGPAKEERQVTDKPEIDFPRARRPATSRSST